MIPGDDFDWFYYDDDSFGGLGGDHGTGAVVEGAGVAFPDGFAYFLYKGGIVVDDGVAFDLDAAQFGVLLTSFDETGESGVAAQVDGFLRFGVGPEGDFVVEKDVPHGDKMGEAIMVNGGNMQGALFFEKVVDFVFGHVNEVAAAHGLPPWK